MWMQDRINQKNSNAFSDTNKIEKIIDEILLKNKEKLDRIQEEKLEFNINRFSIKNKHGDTIFYIKKSSKKTNDKIFLTKDMPEKTGVKLEEEKVSQEKKFKEKIKSKVLPNNSFLKKICNYA